MKVLYIEPFKHPKVTDISLVGPDFNNLVHGEYGFCSVLPDVDLITNDIGKLIGLSPNRVIGNDLICGPCFFVGSGYDINGELDYADLPEHRIKALTNMFYDPLSPHECLMYTLMARKWIKPDMIEYHNKKYPQFKVNPSKSK